MMTYELSKPEQASHSPLGSWGEPWSMIHMVNSEIRFPEMEATEVKMNFSTFVCQSLYCNSYE